MSLLSDTLCKWLDIAVWNSGKEKWQMGSPRACRMASSGHSGTQHCSNGPPTAERVKLLQQPTGELPVSTWKPGRPDFTFSTLPGWPHVALLVFTVSVSLPEAQRKCNLFLFHTRWGPAAGAGDTWGTYKNKSSILHLHRICILSGDIETDGGGGDAWIMKTWHSSLLGCQANRGSLWR